MKWYVKQGEQSDVVLSTRIRLARNLKSCPFPVRLDRAGKKQVCERVRDALSAQNISDLSYIEMSSLSSVEAVSLAERHLVSPEFISNDGGALLLSEDEGIGVMLCEEDHIRLQVMKSGLALDEAYEDADKIDNALDKTLDFAFDERIGYLTQCPTNLGTGMRASVMLHLPALSAMGNIPRLASTVAKLGLTLRGAYGDASSPSSDIYQLSNQVTLGISEQAALQNLKSIVMQVVSQERQARQSIVKDERFVDRIHRAYGLLMNAYMMTSAEFMQLSSLVRLGAAQNILEADTEKLNELFVSTQPATLNASKGGELSASQRDVLRAKAIKQALIKE